MADDSLIDRLRRLAVGEFGGDDFAWLSAAIGAYLSGAASGQTMEGALGLTPRAGGEHWWRREARQRRDALIRSLADQLCPGGSLSDREAAVRAELRRYGRRWQRIDRLRQTAPDSYSDEPICSLLYGIFHADRMLHSGSQAAVPISRSALRLILTGASSAGARAARKQVSDRRTKIILSARRRERPARVPTRSLKAAKVEL